MYPLRCDGPSARVTCSVSKGHKPAVVWGSDWPASAWPAVRASWAPDHSVNFWVAARAVNTKDLHCVCCGRRRESIAPSTHWLQWGLPTYSSKSILRSWVVYKSCQSSCSLLASVSKWKDGWCVSKMTHYLKLELCCMFGKFFGCGFFWISNTKTLSLQNERCGQFELQRYFCT